MASRSRCWFSGSCLPPHMPARARARRARRHRASTSTTTAYATLDPIQSFQGPNHGSYSIDAGSDLDMSHVNWKAGYVLINVFGSPAHPGARHLTIRDSALNQIYKNGNMKIYDDTEAIGRIDISNSTLTAKDPDGGI